MKRIYLAGLIILSMTGSCLKEIVCIDGNGQVTTETRQVADINTIVNTTAVDVVYKKSGSTGIAIKAESNLISHIVTSASNGRLEIKTTPRNTCFNSTTRPLIVVSSPFLTTMEQTGPGSFDADTLEGPSVLIRSTASGNMQVSYVSTDALEVTITGSGDLNLDRVVCTGSDFTLTASGNLEVTGTGDNSEMRVTGSGDVHSVDFVLHTAKETITGSGNIYTHILNNLDAVISGSGNIYLRGNPVVKQSLTGSGSIIPY